MLFYLGLGGGGLGARFGKTTGRLLALELQPHLLDDRNTSTHHRMVQEDPSSLSWEIANRISKLSTRKRKRASRRVETI